jgi:cation:H+ antiporter
MSGDAVWLAAFATSLVVVLAASDRLVAAVEAAGDRYGWAPGLVGLLAAAGADGPEISAAIIALLAGAHEVSLGVIVGSNLFNLAALLGLPILLVGYVAIQRQSVALNGVPMLATTVLAALLMVGALPALPVDLLVLIVLAVYALLLAHPPLLARGTGERQDEGSAQERAREREADVAQGFPTGARLLAQGLVATGVVIGGCSVLVQAALYLGPRLGFPPAVTGTFGLAALTSLPNVWVAVTLARRRRGVVLLSAVCNSNTINAVFGICVPALIAGLQPTSLVRHLDIPALVGLTLLAVGLVWWRRGLDRRGAACLVLAYAAFAATRLVLSH